MEDGREADRVRRRDLFRALVLAVVVVGIGPFLGLLRDALLAAFPRGFIPLLTGVVAVAVAAALGVAIARHGVRLRPLAGAGLAIALVAVWIAARSTGIGRVDAVERIHFVLYGSLGALLWRAARGEGRLAAAAIAVLGASGVGIVDELVQWWVPSRTGDVRDVFLNAWAGAAGALFGASVWPAAPASRASRRGRRAVRLLAGAVVVLLAAFLDAAHLGYEIRDAEAGRFRSWFSEARLRGLQEERARSWRHGPPPARPALLSREDFYRSEGAWRVQARNEALESGDRGRAWRENRILERWYAPLLDLSSPRTGAPFRLAPWDRATLEAARPADAAADASPLFEDRIWLRPTPAELRVAAALALAALAAAGRRGTG